MKKPTINQQDAARVVEQIMWLCISTLVQSPHKHPIAFLPYNPFEPFEEEFAHSKLTLTEMAERCNMQISTFKRKFAEYYGLSPHKWQLKQRLTRAAALLTTTDLLVKQICYECNFATPSHFIRSFKKEFGCTPKQYRKQFKE